ncbi:peptidoglycan-binding protein [Streptomyces sp. NPDC046862]|uniref:peptidoglycan-binding domain-containing protein n=1 Tax=Streptomyces sp. NPDC046862 TaxID=3154603 RepID=UPI00345129CD
MSEASGNGGEPHGHTCPECAAPRALDGTPSCSCNRRASEALRDARTAEAAAAEDFDPLRIRPYVELGGEPDGPPTGAPATPSQQQQKQQQQQQPDDIPTLAMPVASTTTRPDSADVQLFEDGPPDPSAPSGPSGSNEPRLTEPTPPSPPERVPRRGRRSRRRMTLAVAGAVATVLAAAGFASGLFSYKAPTRDQALPDDHRASVPDTSTDGEASPTEPSGATPSTPAASNTTPAPSSTSAAPSPSEPRDSARPSSPSPTPTRAAPSADATTPKAPGSDETDDQRRPQTLRLGDDGPEVTELQLRLRQLAIYLGDIDENFDEQVEASVRQYQFTRGVDDDDPGVYGGATRDELESETKEP